MEPSTVELFVTLGLFVQTVGAGLLALIFLSLSRGHGHRVLNAAGYGRPFLFLALGPLIISNAIHSPFGNLPFEYFKILYFASLVVAADRMEHESSLAKPLRMAAVLGLVVSFGAGALT